MPRPLARSRSPKADASARAKPGPRAPRRVTAPAAPSRRAGYHHGDLRRALTEAAVDLIATGGPDFKLREAARAVGVNHAAVYRHFQDKTALLAAVAEQGFQQLAEAMRTASEAAPLGDPLERLRRAGGAYVVFALENPSHFRVMFGARLNEDGAFPSLELAAEGAFALVQGEARRATGKAGVAPTRERHRAAQDVAISLWTMAHGYASLVLTRRIKVRSTRVASEYFTTLLEPLLLGLRGGAAP